MRNLAELNINEGGRPVERPTPSEKLFHEFESKTGLRIPPELRELLKFSNGGHPELDSVHGSRGQFAVDTFYHLTPDDRGPESLWYAAENWGAILGRAALPFAADAGGSQFFLDLGCAPARVRLCLHAEGMRIVDVSCSLDEFLNALEIDPDMI
jgi:hypothetical protein